jgi:hypothetical protein
MVTLCFLCSSTDLDFLHSWFLRSQAGIDVCAERLADEIRDIKAEHPSLEFISLVGLSIGGLICRCAIDTSSTHPEFP